MSLMINLLPDRIQSKRIIVHCHGMVRVEESINHFIHMRCIWWPLFLHTAADVFVQKTPTKVNAPIYGGRDTRRISQRQHYQPLMDIFYSLNIEAAASRNYLGQIGNIIIHLGFAYYWAGMEKSCFYYFQLAVQQPPCITNYVFWSASFLWPGQSIKLHVIGSGGESFRVGMIVFDFLAPKDNKCFFLGIVISGMYCWLRKLNQNIAKFRKKLTLDSLSWAILIDVTQLFV